MLRRPLIYRRPITSIAVFRALHLGDMLYAVPALRALRSALPQAHITLVGLPWARHFVRRFRHYLDDFIAFPGHPALLEQPVRQAELTPFYASMSARHFSLALQLHGDDTLPNQIVASFGAQTMAGSCRGAAVTTPDCMLFPLPEIGAESERLLRQVERIGARSAGAHLEFPLAPEDRAELAASGLATDLTPGNYICVHPGARKRERCWPAHRFAEVADRLAAEFGVGVVLTGPPRDATLTRAVARHMRSRSHNAAAPLSIGALAALLKNARLLLCNDTGISQLAASLRLNSVVIFSQPDIARWAPLDRDRHHCIWDPDAQRSGAVLEHARALLAGTERARQRSLGMWPYW